METLTNGCNQNELALIQCKKSLKKFLFEHTRNSDFRIVELSNLRRHYYSYTFTLKIFSDSSLIRLYLKIPKKNLRDTTENIFPIRVDDRPMGEEEIKSLKYIENYWSSTDLGVMWVKPYGYVSEINGVLTHEVIGDDAIKIFRRDALFNIIGLKKNQDKFNDFLKNFGRALGRFHEKTKEQKNAIPLNGELQKVLSYCRLLSDRGVIKNIVKYTQVFNSVGRIQVLSNLVPTFKGLDIRNVLIGLDGNYYILDPGRLKIALPEAELARFIVTIKLLHWGTLALYIFRLAKINYEKFLIESYQNQSNKIDDAILSFYTLKEALKHAINIFQYIDSSSWPKVVKNIMIKFYVTPFFSCLIEGEYRNLIKNLEGRQI
jgi:hypothetical protein